MTSLIAAYRRIQSLSHGEQVHEAKTFLDEPSRLPTMFVESVNEFAEYDNSQSPFHPGRARIRPAPRSLTARFARRLEEMDSPVPTHPHLEFQYVDRELVPVRSTDGRVFSDGSSSRNGERLDLLLRNRQDGLPIVAEVKVGRDKTPFVGLVQALALAALLMPAPQRRRIMSHYPEADFRWLECGPFVDVYVLLVDPPSTSKHWGDLLEATGRIAAGFVSYTPALCFVRRVVCLTGPLDGTAPLCVRFEEGGDR